MSYSGQPTLALYFLHIWPTLGPLFCPNLAPYLALYEPNLPKFGLKKLCNNA